MGQSGRSPTNKSINYTLLFIRPYAQIGPRRGKRKEARGKAKRQRQRQRGGRQRGKRQTSRASPDV